MAKDENEVAPLFGGQVVVGDAARLAQAMADTEDSGGPAGDVSFMSFSGKTGRYKIGVDKREPGENEPFVVAITLFELGWMCWKGGKPVSKRMANIEAPRIMDPDPDEFGPFDSTKNEGWQRSRALTAKSLENDEQVYFTTSSKSGVGVFSDFQKLIKPRLLAGEPAWPVVTFGMEEFPAQGYTNPKPKIDVIRWLSDEEFQSLSDPDLDPMDLLEAPDAPEPPKKPSRPKRRL